MSQYPEDTERDALSAQVRSIKPLGAERIGELLDAARSGDLNSRQQLVEQQFGTILESALAHESTGISLTELFQEGGIAALIGIEEYAGRGGGAAGLGVFVRELVDAHLKALLSQAASHQIEAKQFIADFDALEAADFALRRELGREPTPVEIAARLEWTSERVATITEMLHAARQMYDEEISQFIDYEGDEESEES